MKKFLISLLVVMFGIIVPRTAFAEDSELFIKAINPGYVVDGVSNVGEMIEIGRKLSDEPLLLTGYSIGYTNSSGKYTVLVDFPENSWMTGESILLRFASSSGFELANLSYNKTLAMKAGPLELRRDGVVIDSVCWTGKDGCLAEFKTTLPTTIVRNDDGNFVHVDSYEPQYNPDGYYEEEEKVELLPQCKGVVFSEVLTYYESEKSEQFIELYNSSSEQIKTDGCKVKYKNKYYDLDGLIKPDGYKQYIWAELALTKNPTNVNILELVDVNDEVVDKLEIFNGQKKGTSYAFIGYDKDGTRLWRNTYSITPGEPNIFQEFRTCEEGKVINTETGNCVKVTEIVEKTCKAGYFLNILTGRCNKIPVVEEKICKTGYHLNPETNRCVKDKINNGADYSLKKEEPGESAFVALRIILGIVGVGVIYIVYEFRREVWKLFGKVFRRFR